MKKKSLKIRKFWKINPRTRVKKSGKIYSRQKQKRQLRSLLKEYGEESH